MRKTFWIVVDYLFWFAASWAAVNGICSVAYGAEPSAAAALALADAARTPPPAATDPRPPRPAGDGWQWHQEWKLWWRWHPKPPAPPVVMPVAFAPPPTFFLSPAPPLRLAFPPPALNCGPRG